MSKTTKHVLIALSLAGLAWLVYGVLSRLYAGAQSITDAIRGTVQGTAAAILYPFSSVSTAVAAAASLPAAAQQSAALDSALATMNTNDYAPGGRIYNNIKAAQGQPAADAAWAAVQDHITTQEAQTSTWWQFWQ